MTIEFEDLVDDGMSHACGFSHQDDLCTSGATTALTWEAFRLIQLPKAIKLYSRALCPTHKGTIVTYGV